MPHWLQFFVDFFTKEKPVPFPVLVTVSCDPNPASDAVTAYHFTQDGGARTSSPTPSVSMSVAAAGSHVFAVVAENQWGDSLPLSATVNINPAGKPTNIKIVKG